MNTAERLSAISPIYEQHMAEVHRRVELYQDGATTLAELEHMFETIYGEMVTTLIDLC